MANSMRGLAAVSTCFAVHRPLSGREVLLHMHLTDETLRLGETMAVGGARLLYLDSARTAPAPSVPARIRAHNGRLLQHLAELDVPTDAVSWPLLVVEGNGRVFNAIHAVDQVDGGLGRVQGISEHTSGGGRQVDEFEERGGHIRVPVVAVYRSHLKTLLETGLGTSQSAAAALLRGLGMPLAGRRVTLIGYGHVGQGLARIFGTLGARLTVVDIRAEARLLAALAGHETDVLPGALSSADIVITATGRPSIVTAAALETAREDVIVGNVSNCTTEIDCTGCQHLGSVGPSIEALQTPSGRGFLLLAGGIQLNHVFEQGNPAELMDLSFSLHALTLEWLANAVPAPAVYPVPPSIIERAAALCLDRSI